MSSASTAPGTYGDHPTPPVEADSAPVPAPDPHAHDMHRLSSQLGALAGILAHIDTQLSSMAPKSDVYRVIQINSAPQRLDRFDRRFSRILVSANLSVTVDTGIGNVTQALTTGWNILNYPDGAFISTAAAAANALYLCSDSQNG